MNAMQPTLAPAPPHPAQ
ncbi:hypothetical protein V494_07970, partial [Pseudogymnoascus sp. VKM F-4513 (FW-928)]